MNRISFRPDKSQVIRFAVSLLLAVLLWGWVTQLKDPFETRTYTNMTVQTSELSDSLQISTNLPQVNVQLKGARSDLASITASQLIISVDTSKVTGPDTYTLPLKVEGIEGSVTAKTEPRAVQVQIEQRETKVFPLTVKKTALKAEDARQIGQVTPNVSQVTVTGPSSLIDGIDQIVLPISLDQQNASFTATFQPIAVDKNGQIISGITILPATISAEVQVDSRGKTVSVIPSITGVPAEGYTIQQRTALPDTILVDGPKSELDKLLFVNTEPVNVQGATDSISQRVGIENLPPGLTIVNPTDGIVEVRIAIEDVSGQATDFSALPIEVVGLGAGLDASITPTTASVSIMAPRSLVETMTAKDIKIRVDLTDLGPGTHIVTPEVTVPQRATWLASQPAQITVVITERSSATPEGSAVASPESSSSPPPDTPTPTSTASQSADIRKRPPGAFQAVVVRCR